MENVFNESLVIKRKDREKILNQKSKIFWFTGLSGSGKSTIAKNFEKTLNLDGKLTYLLDGDNFRLKFSKDLGFTKEDREENIKRASEVCKVLIDSGVIVLATFISPTNQIRDSLREKFKEDYIEVYVKCNLDTCKKRDVKGLYKKALDNKIENFTGIYDGFQEPKNPDIILDTDKYSLEESLGILQSYFKENI